MLPRTVRAVGVVILIAASGALAAPIEQVREDWLKQNAVRWNGPGSATTPEEDARGAVDGVIDGRWSFHTGLEESPWWQVDLGEVRALSRVVVYNRCDGAADRAATLRLLLSEDGVEWREAFANDGTVFYGFTDGRPLDITLEARARFVRLTVPGVSYLHLDEVEVYGPGSEANLALHQPANQSSISEWSQSEPLPGSLGVEPKDVLRVVEQGLGLARELGDQDAARRLTSIAERARSMDDGEASQLVDLLMAAHGTIRPLVLGRPELDFDDLLFVKRAPGSFSHMSDQNYGWWSRPGGGIYILEGFRNDEPRLRCLTEGWPEGSFLSPDLSYDGRRIVFAYCRYYPDLANRENKVAKQDLPEDGFYHLFEMNVDGSGVRQLTRGRYDDFDGRYLPNGSIAFLSTRRGQSVQTRLPLTLSTVDVCLPDGYVRCGGDAWRPVAIYTLHVLDPSGAVRAISPFENFEWTPSVAADGRILYARWDYVDRDNMPYMGLWSTLPDGTNPRAVYGNFTHAPHCVFEARAVPNSAKLLFTASAHHSITGGSLVLLDPSVGVDGPEPLRRVTPEVCFPEIEGWPVTYYASPWPLSESCWLTAWSDCPLGAQGALNPVDAMGIYLGDIHGNLELIYRDPDITSMYPIPLRPRPRPPVLATALQEASLDDVGHFVLMDIYQGLTGVERGAVRSLRVVGVPPKTQPWMNTPSIGVTADDPGKFVVGTVPIAPDGSAYFSAPAGVTLFFQALDQRGRALQTMRSATYLQPGQTLSCIGCHEDRGTAPANLYAGATAESPARLTPGPDGSWPLRYDRLVQPVLDAKCVSCHSPGSENGGQALDLSTGASWQALLNYGSPSLAAHVLSCYRAGRSTPGTGAAIESPLLRLLGDGHYDVELSEEEWERLVTWMDTYGQSAGSFSPEQEAELLALRERLAAALLE